MYSCTEFRLYYDKKIKMMNLSDNYYLLISCVITILFASCSILSKKTSPEFYDKGIKINGVRWATRNVDKPGAFANKPEDSGMFYQWNSKTHWPASGGKTYWPSAISQNEIWAKANDPSPVGWRIPSFEEIIKLADTSKVNHEWISQNNIIGLKCTDKRTGKSIFLPYSGYRDSKNDGSRGSEGRYWSSQKYESSDTDVVTYAYYMYIFAKDIWPSHQATRLGFTVRCVSQ